ncbi:23S rRNA (cytidine1920-2'-O)/16S rRNA (cytidine1409-2'-O)-methyltransferase [Anaerosphaera aminiphila DSM 21120]|uniref:23S rRNA (Cytidine1920-2'-O)/16S rRNA (Cytidine1409-2'-O)-methyltransferase n=1 Tax=Anaerosphaera aminiphila DSM 21120 TaxID=1120995 RepID=A0A1M5P8Z3_9FIRM|nr:TlyA family RNA methyltransferase [Anaerosphaera aminiphila]SHG98250.1 23S rRNA (cytidine1920-2'-O)/16S rRNA (cytidine1409-2'-O)-methyltransferase [Anaerosphaera aminiphila DSM 21120]
MVKERADVLLVNKDLAPSREKAKRLIMSGEVFIGTQRVEKPGQLINIDEDITIKSNSLKYVSRGGFKLEKAINLYNLNLKDLTCMDIGASTGGFTQCMLFNGAKKVYAIDVGYNQLDYSLRIDDRVISMEKTNIRTFDRSKIAEPIDFISIDVSFISLELVLPKAVELLREDGKIVALIKPQFEAGRDKVGKKGIVRDNTVHKEVIEKVINIARDLNLRILGLTYSPIKGATGNVEFLILFENSNMESVNLDIDSVIGESNVM